MSATLEMVANTVLAAPRSTRKRRGEDVEDRDTSGLSGSLVADASSLRAKKVTMAAEHLASAQDRRTDDSQERIDVFV